jgi:hypothetical protein
VPEIPEEVRSAFAELERKEQNLSNFRSLRESLAVDQPPAPTPASDGEREELAQWIEKLGDNYDDLYRLTSDQVIPRLTRAALLLRHPTPAAVPVAVSESPWEREGWCDWEGRCWWFNQAGIPEWQLADGGPYGDFCLPHWAIPVPQPPQGEEVQS